DEVKKATVFVKVEAGEFSGSGSGFLVGAIGQTGLVATNHHVIESGMKRPAPGSPPHKISVVFNSGQPDEYELPAAVTAIDPIADLAVLRVRGRLPAKIIDPWQTPKLTETLEVLIFGFPFGSQLATAGDHPAISVNAGSVSSLRTDKAGKLEQVQISGPINPGNSGGPIVDKDGRLVGIAVATITGSGLGFAVPVNELIALMEGKLLATLFVPTGLDSGFAKFKVVIPVMDPGGLVKTVYIRYWAGGGVKPKVVKDRAIGYRPIPNGEGTGQLNLAVGDGPTSLQLAIGDLELPANATEVVLQVASESQAGLVAASPPVTYSLTLAEQPSGRDAKPFADLSAHLASNPDSRAGQVVVVRGKIIRPPSSRAPVQEMTVSDLDGRVPGNVRFICDRETAAQFDEVDPEHQPLDARITCVVGGRGADGRVPVRVARVDFLDEGDRPVKSIPGEAKDDKLAALNRDPAKFAGQTMDVKAEAAPVARFRGATPEELPVFFPSLSRPRNLQFVATPGLAARMAEEKLKVNGLYKVRLSVTVAAPTTPEGRARVTVRRIEILDPKDGNRVVKTIE
ncbi:MAG: serine protease, partial [Gemmataceae bacterium]|nr:serine protease [Gemmataceae bacterium]